MSDGNHASLNERIKSFISLYNEAEGVYKSVQQIVLRIDAQIHNEFRYCARGLTDFLCHIYNDNENAADINTALTLLSRADHAARNALNDSIDLMVAYAKIEINKLASIDTGRPISSYYTDFSDVKAAITRIESKAEKTRQNRHSRLEEYIGISNSDDFLALKKFCQHLPYIENEIGVEYGKKVAEGRRFLITVFLSLLGIVIGIPGFFEWASKHVLTNLDASIPQQQMVSPTITPALPQQQSGTAAKSQH